MLKRKENGWTDEQMTVRELIEELSQRNPDAKVEIHAVCLNDDKRLKVDHCSTMIDRGVSTVSYAENPNFKNVWVDDMWDRNTVVIHSMGII